MEVIPSHADWRPAHQKGQWWRWPKAAIEKALANGAHDDNKENTDALLRKVSRAENQEPKRLSAA
jgi:hypothetical protein